MLDCTEVFAKGRVILVIHNSIYPIQTAANPCFSFGTVLRVRPEQSQRNNMWSFYKSLFWQILSGQCKTVPYCFSLDIQWNTILIVLVLFQAHRRGMEFPWPLYEQIFSGFLHLLQRYLAKLCPFLIFTCKGLQYLSQVALSSVRNMNSLIRGPAEAILSFFPRNRVASRINKGLFSHPPVITSSNKDQV